MEITRPYTLLPRSAYQSRTWKHLRESWTACAITAQRVAILLQFADLSLAPGMGTRRRRFEALESFVKPRAKLVKQSLCSWRWLWNAIKTSGLVLLFYFFSITLTFYNQKYFHVRVLPHCHYRLLIHVRYNYGCTKSCH